jgi:Leucine-rich repeat (LRR) protein
MKILILSMVMLVMAYFSDAQNVNIPDTNFKNALISMGVDANEDGEISYTESEAITFLDISYRFILDSTGIEAFINLDSLDCTGNQLTSLDVSNNPSLKQLGCANNQLTGLDVSGLIGLTDLDCGVNQLTNLNVSDCDALIYLFCSINNLTSLDISDCNRLQQLYCGGNPLTSLDISNNKKL